MNKNLEKAKSFIVSKFKFVVKKIKGVNLKTAIIVAAIVIIAGLGYYCRGLFIAAIVNGSPITRLSVIRQLENKSGKALLDTLITQKLIDQEAKKKGITVSKDEIDAEMKNVETQLQGQGQTLDQALASEGMTNDEFIGQIITQKNLEKLIADKIQVTDAEVEQYIKDNNVTIPSGKETDYKNQIKDYLKGQKMSSAAQPYINSLRSQASILNFVNYR